MKTLKFMLIVATAAVTAVSCGTKTENKEEAVQENETPKVLVLYYSLTSTTQDLATEIATKLDADIEELALVNPYDTNFDATVERGLRELEQGSFPEILPLEADLSKYDVVFIGFPVWFDTYAMPIATLLEDYDFSGKKIVPFCTFGSGGLESSVANLAKAEPKAEILPGYGVRAARMEAMPKEVDNFLKANGFLDGEYIQLPEFPEQHEVSDEEAEIFNAAVAGYPMLNAQAKTVASRQLPNGMEYLFTALDFPRDPNSQEQPNEIKVYVTVENGVPPEFTKVIR